MELFEIGKPSRFHAKADPNNRHSNYIKSKMNIVDIIPCATLIDISQMKDVVNQGKDIISNLLPQIDYNAGISQFKKLQQAYGLEQYSGIRLYLTDETTSSDSFNNQFEDSFFQGFLNKLSGMGATIRQFGRSVNSQYNDIVDKLANQISNQVKSVVASKIPEDYQAQAQSIGNAFKKLAKIAAKGNKVPLPKIWSQSNYTPGLTAVIKLVSPYGNPEAIAEYIIKPLVYLLLMAAPQTDDGVSYGLAQTFTVHAYGITRLLVACVSDITLRRGGNDSSFNIYRQPLSVDVSVQFQTIVEGFGAFKVSNSFEKQAVQNASQLINANSGVSNQRGALFQTVGGIVQSLRPVYLPDSTVTALQLGINGQMDYTTSELQAQIAQINALAQTMTEQGELISQNFIKGDFDQSKATTLAANINDVGSQIQQSAPLDEATLMG